MNIKKSKTNIPANPQGLKCGDKVIDSRGEIYTIGKVTKKGFEILDSDDGSFYGKKTFEENNNGRRESYSYIKINDTSSLEDDLCNLIRSDLSELREEKVSDSTALTVANNELIYTQKELLEKKRNEIEILNRFMEAKQNQLSNLVSNLNDQVRQVKKVIAIIELYMGINEEIVQIIEGPHAPIETPISFRQLVLHMDEEVAITKDQGIDFYQIDKFDKWMIKNYKTILPEEKCIVVARPRRNKKRYDENELVNSNMNDGNFSTYVLIRNGANVYRLTTDQNIYPYLFPAKNEMEELHKKTEDMKGWGSDRDKAEDEILKYKRNVLMLQGIIDRTDIFKPIPPELNLLKPETYNNHLNFIYDGTGLADGRISYFEWLKEMNKDLKVGDRFYFTGFDYNDDKEYRMASIGWESYNEKGIPHEQHPDKQVYNIVREEEGSARYSNSKVTRLVFNYKPNDAIYSDSHWRTPAHTRKRANTYYVYRNDSCIINYEKVKIEDIDYYINDRINKQHYLKMLPILKGIKEQLLKEQKLENEFKKLVSSQFKEDVSEILDETIEWWKNKVKIKRPLISDDAKALRMITSRVNKLIKG